LKDQNNFSDLIYSDGRGGEGGGGCCKDAFDVKPRKRKREEMHFFSNLLFKKIFNKNILL